MPSSLPMQIHCRDAVIMRIKNHFGHAWSPKFGRIFFKRKNVVNIDGLEISDVAPGTLCDVWATKNIHGTMTSWNMDEAQYMDIKWRATDVELMHQRSPVVREGVGTISSAHTGFGFLESPTFALTLFVPGFAAGNNFTTQAPKTLQLPDLLGRTVHFLAIPNPKHRFQNYFVIALHLVEPSCDCNDSDLPVVSDCNHWVANCGGGGGVGVHISRSAAGGAYTDTTEDDNAACNVSSHSATDSLADVIVLQSASVPNKPCSQNMANEQYMPTTVINDRKHGQDSSNNMISSSAGPDPNVTLPDTRDMEDLRCHDLFLDNDCQSILFTDRRISDAKSKRVQCSDAILIMNGENFAYLWSETHGIIYTEPTAFKHGLLKDLVVGQQMTVTFIRSPTGRLRATYLIKSAKLSDLVESGMGRPIVDGVSTHIQVFNMLGKDSVPRIFMPDWASVRQSVKVHPDQMGLVHYLAVKQTQPVKRLCVINVHALQDSCVTANNDRCCEHWKKQMQMQPVLSPHVEQPNPINDNSSGSDAVESTSESEDPEQERWTMSAGSSMLITLPHWSEDAGHTARSVKSTTSHSSPSIATRLAASKPELDLDSIRAFVVYTGSTHAYIRPCITTKQGPPALVNSDSLIAVTRAEVQPPLEWQHLVPGMLVTCTVDLMACTRGSAVVRNGVKWIAKSVHQIEDDEEGIWAGEIEEGLGAIRQASDDGSHAFVVDHDTAGSDYMVIADWALRHGRLRDMTAAVHYVCMPPMDATQGATYAKASSAQGIQKVVPPEKAVVIGAHVYTTDCDSYTDAQHWSQDASTQTSCSSVNQSCSNDTQTTIPLPNPSLQRQPTTPKLDKQLPDKDLLYNDLMDIWCSHRITHMQQLIDHCADLVNWIMFDHPVDLTDGEIVKELVTQVAFMRENVMKN